MNDSTANLFNQKTALLEYKKKIDVELKKYFQHKILEYEKISEFAGMFTKDLADFTLRGGKRLRSALLYYSYKLFGGIDDKEIIKLSMFVELIESFLLIHDDIMDRSSMRRGGITIHKKYEKYSNEQNFQDDIHLGNTMGILSGDLANQLALEIIGKSNFPFEYKNKVIKVVADEISKVCFGQIHDILLNYNFPKNYQENDIIKVYLYKTSTYTYSLPLFTGAILAGANDEDLKILDEYAVPSGIAFQIRDDVLGAFGIQQETGKDTKGDIIEGKKTLLVTQSYKNGTKEQKRILDKYLGKPDLTDSEADEVREIFISTGALDYSKIECKKHIEKAKDSLKILSGKNTEAYKFLEGIADYMIIRKV